MAVSALSEISLTPIFDNNGALVRNARLYFYKVDTLDPYTVYQDQELGAPWPFPVVTGGSGRVPPIYVGSEPYRMRIFDNANQLIEDIPYLPGATEATGGGGGGEGETAIVTGDVVWAFSNGGVRAGWVRLNGGTIGNALSGANERANDDAHDLFVWLWGQDTGNVLTVTPTKGASAESDWLANKQLTLPDGANMVLGGISTMGRPARNLFADLTPILGTSADVGSRFGTATHVLTTPQLPGHTHGITDAGHTHVSTQAAHSHVVNDPTHTHTINQSPHAHGVSDPGHAHSVYDPGHAHSGSVSSHNHDYTRYGGTITITTPGGAASYSGVWQGTNTVNTQSVAPGVTINAAGTGIGIYAAGTGISIVGANANVSNAAAATGITLQNATPAITVQTAVTGVTVDSAGGGQKHPITQPTLLGSFYMRL